MTRLRTSPHFHPLALLAILTLLFFAHVLWPVEGQAIGSHDMRGLFYPWLELTRNKLFSGELPLWDGSRFAGYPFLSNPQVALFYPPTWLAIVFKVNLGITLYLMLHVWLAGAGIYLFVVGRQPDPSSRSVRQAAVLAALTLMFSGFVATRIFAGHIGLLAVHSWIGWLLWLSDRALTRRTWASAVLVGVPLGLAILAGHTTSLLYIGLVWGLYTLFRTWEVRTNWRSLGQLWVIASVIALLLSAVQLLALAQFTGLAARSAEASFDFATGFSFPPTHLITLFNPEYFGEPTRMGYWSVPNFEELTVYAGTLPLLALLLAVSRPNRRTWFWIGIVTLGILLAFGSYGFLYRIFYDFVPPFRLARAPGRAMFLYVLGGSVLVGETLARLRRERQPMGPSAERWIILLLLAGVVALAATGAVFTSVHPSDTSGRLWHQLGGWLKWTFLLGIGAALLRHWLRPAAAASTLGRLLPLLLIALVVSDLWLFGFKLIRRETITPDGFWYAAATHVGPDHQRILPWGINIFQQNGAGQVGLDSVFGYNALEVGASTALFQQATDPRSAVYDLFAADFVVSTTPLDQFTDGENGLIPVSADGGAWVYQRPRALPLAWAVTASETVDSAKAIAQRVVDPAFSAAQTALQLAPTACPLAGGPPPQIAITERRDGFWQLQTNGEQPALLIVSETAYPGWRVTIDGERASAETAFSTLRAVCVPAGSHTITWRFVPTAYLWGGALTLIGILCVIVAYRQNRQFANP